MKVLKEGINTVYSFFYETNVNDLDEEGNTPLMIACREKNLESVIYLLSQGSNVAARNIYKFTPLHVACYNMAPIEIIQALLDSGAEIDAVEQNGWTPLIVASSRGFTKLVSFLLEKGANVDAQSLTGQTSLFIASHNGFCETVKELLAHKADPTIRTKQKLESPLYVAIGCGHRDIAELLVGDRHLMTLATNDGALPIHVATGMKRIDLLEFLIENGADINAPKRDGSCAIHIAVAQGEIEVVRLLLRLKCDVQSKDSFGCTPLHKACLKQYPEIVSLLLENGAKANLLDNDGLTPLHVLCSSPVTLEKRPSPDCNLTIFKILISNGGDLFSKDETHAIPLHHAVCRKDNFELVKAILEMDIKTAFQEDRSGRTPLHLLRQMYKFSDIDKLLTDSMREYDPKFFESFDEKKRIQVEEVIHSKLSEEEKAGVFEGDISLKGVAKKILSGKIKNIIVLTGAGISTSAGIPDFRSPDKGIYTNPKISEKLNFPSQDALSLSAFAQYPEIFYAVIKEIFLPCSKNKYKPTLSHHFISLLEKKNLLLRNYTQNIDTLERQAGVSAEKLVEAHGSFAAAFCESCGVFCKDMDYFWNCVEKDELPRCSACTSNQNTNRCLLKPDVVLFGESLPAKFYDVQKLDFEKCDLLIVMGTSLKVYPFAGLVNQVHEKTPRLLFNKDPVAAFTKGVKEKILAGNLSLLDSGLTGTYRDLAVLGEIDEGIKKFLEFLGWEKEINYEPAEKSEFLPTID